MKKILIVLFILFAGLGVVFASVLDPHLVPSKLSFENENIVLELSPNNSIYCKCEIKDVHDYHCECQDTI